MQESGVPSAAWSVQVDDKFRALLESSPDAMVIVDQSGRIVLANSQTEKMFGYTNAELMGEPVEMLMPEKFRIRHVEHRLGYAVAPHARPMGIGMELLGQRKDGTAFPVEISLSPLEGETSKYYASAIRDVTERKKAEERIRLSEERFRLLVDEIRDHAIFMLDPDGNVMSWNKGAEALKGYAAEEIVGKDFAIFYPSEDVARGKPQEFLKKALEQGRGEDEGWRLRKDGSRFWASVVLSPIRDKDGKLLGFTKIVRDLTERKRARDTFLLEITNTLVSHLDARQLLSAVASCLHQIKEHDFATIALYDSPSDTLHVQVLDREKDHSIAVEEAVLPTDGSMTGWAYVNARSFVMTGDDGEQLPAPLMADLQRQKIRSGCWIPLKGRAGVLGTLNIFSRTPAVFSEDDLGLLTQVANQVAIALENALAYRHVQDITQKLAEEKQYLEDELRTEFNFEEIIGDSKPLKRVLKQIETVAPTDSTVLILGETGTGKELLARAVHNLSPRSKGTFVRVNCASIPAGLLESELFGHEKGAFTGAIAQRIGRLELADGGTLFLDEVGDIPLELQPKLLRVLQEKEFERLGSTRTLTTDVRIVSATNRDLGKAVASGQFRSDLFYRLNVFPLNVPPLRERRDDIPLLVKFFVAKFAGRMKKNIENIPPDAMEALCRYGWPGNIRELEHMIERAVILTRGTTLSVPPFEAPPEETSAASSLEDVEREHILRVLRETKGKIGGPGGAAERLGMNRTTLNSKMQRLNITRRDL
jgi:formate hydrogenlyase transcriptional activator